MLSWSLLALAFSISRASAQALNISDILTPKLGPCPADFQLVRSAGSVANQSLGPDELAYVTARAKDTIPAAWKTYLANVQATNVTVPDYVVAILNGSSKEAPNLGIAISGGGYRAAIFGAGVINALDNRNASSKAVGTGGLLQAATYLTGLSGGSWLLTAYAQANFPPIQTLALGPGSGGNTWGGFNAHFDVFAPANDTTKDELFLLGLAGEAKGKYAAGFPITINDIWSRALARHFLNGTSADFFANNTSHGAGILFSDIANVSAMVNHQAPFPIVVTNSKSPKGVAANIGPLDFIPFSNIIYEFSPFEMGSYDPPLASFTPTKYLGTTNTSVCVTEYEQASFVLGTSSELFNEFNTSTAALLNTTVGPLLSIINSSFAQPSGIELDVTLYPNPFIGVQKDTFIDTNETYISMVDGGEDGEVIPIQPLLVKARGVDIILAIDASNDIGGYSAGGSLLSTQNRTTFYPSAYSFPAVPKTLATYVSQGLAAHPSFFGCNTTTTNASTPLVIYLANGAAPPGQPHLTNTTTGQTAYEDAQIQGMLDQTFVIATQGIANATVKSDPEWPACLACAVVDRARERSGVLRSGVCAGCFARYCWSGVEEAAAGPGSGSGGHSGALASFAPSRLLWVAAAMGAVLAAL